MRKYGISIFLFLSFIFGGIFTSAVAATYDATGTWTYVESDAYDSCETAVAESGSLQIYQDGDFFTFQIDGETFSGTVSGATYTAYEGDGSSEIQVDFTLSSDFTGSGTVSWFYYDSDTCEGGAKLTLNKEGGTSNPVDNGTTYDASGTWYVTQSNLSNDCNQPNTPENDYIKITQNGKTFSFTDEDGTFSGTVNGSVYTVSESFTEDDGGLVNITAVFTLTSASEGSGEFTGNWSDGEDVCNFSGDLTFKKNNSGGDKTPDYSGSFKWQTTEPWDNCPKSGQESEMGNSTAKIDGDGSFTLERDGTKFTSFNGRMDGNTLTYSATWTHANGGTINESGTVTMTSETKGTGEITWTHSGAYGSCNGGSGLSVSKIESSGGGGGGGGCFINELTK